MSGIALGLGAVSLAATAYGAIESKKAANTAASVDTATAAFNAKVDTSMAQQIDLDTQQNIDTERQDERIYLSREAAGYASSGVLATTGSPLHAQLTNVGRFTQKIQQDYRNSQIQQQRLYVQAKEGVAAGNAQASADTSRGSLALIQGGAQIAGMAFGDYNKGLFNFSGGSGSEGIASDGLNSLGGQTDLATLPNAGSYT